MKVILVRHAKSAYDWNKWPLDYMRHLSKKGVSRQHKVAERMVRENLNFEKVWVSPYTRAQQTLDIILKYYQVKVPVIIKKELIPSGNPYLVVQQLLAETENNPNPEASLLLVGHNPTLSQVLELICSSTGEESPEMHTSDVALCEVLENKTRLIRYFPRNELIKNGKK